MRNEDARIDNLSSTKRFAERELLGLNKALISAGLRISAKRYLKIVVLLSVLLAVIAASLLFLSKEDALMIISVAMIVLGAAYILGKKIPSFLSKSRAEAIESDLPIALHSIAIQLNMRLPFELALENVANWGFQCSPEFARAIEEISHGVSIPEALQAIGSRVDSTIVKKVVAQLVRAYEEGTGGSELKRLADELISVQKLKLRAFGAQVSFLGLLFIAIACVAPTLYLVYAMVSSIYLGSKMDPSEIWLMFLGVFPAIVATITLYIRLRMPKAIVGESEKMFSGKEKMLMHRELEKFGIAMRLSTLFAYSLILSFLFSMILFLLVPSSVPYNFVLLLLPVAGYFILLYRIDARAKEIEDYLPDALFQVAAFERGVPMERMIKNIAKSGYKSLSDEFTMAARQISAGASVAKALSAISKRTASKLLERTIVLLNQCYRTGKDTQVAVRETAEDIFEMLMLNKEQASMLAMQRYTILFGGCIIIPVILAFVISIIGGLGYQAGGLSKITEVERSTLISTAINAIQYYLVIYVLLASIFISYQEGKARKFIVYAIIFTAVALTIFNIVRAQTRI